MRPGTTSFIFHFHMGYSIVDNTTSYILLYDVALLGMVTENMATDKQTHGRTDIL